MTDRRGFLRGLVMSITASGIILPNAAQALIMGDRYARLVNALNAVIKTKPQALLSENDPLQMQHQYAFEEYLRIICEDFSDVSPLILDYQGTKAKLSQVIFPSFSLDILSEDDMQRYEDVIIAVATMKALGTIHGLRVRLNRAIGPMRVYLDRYGQIIRDVHQISVVTSDAR